MQLLRICINFHQIAYAFILVFFCILCFHLSPMLRLKHLPIMWVVIPAKHTCASISTSLTRQGSSTDPPVIDTNMNVIIQRADVVCTLYHISL